LPGRVVAMDFAGRLPHMGWNDVVAERAHPLAESLPAVCYFAHSYAVEPANDRALVATTELDGRRFASMAGAGRIAGTQFHPEKSGPAGGRSCAASSAGAPMLRRRIIPCLDVRGGRLVKGVRF